MPTLMIRDATAVSYKQQSSNRSSWPPATDEHYIRLDERDFRTSLLKLLDSAHQVLCRDRVQAGQFINEARTVVRQEIERADTSNDVPFIAGRKRHLPPWRARRALEVIETHLGRTINTEELATAARLSVSYFSRAFRADFGLSPHEYVIRRRIQRAQELMLVTDRPLASIAIQCGWADQAHYTRMFRRTVGVTPARWRRLRAEAR
jgi:AraC family transcriptional regulator